MTETERQAAISALQARRAARGMNDPLNRLRAHVATCEPIAAVEELTFQATGDETEIYLASDDDARPVALVPFYDGQDVANHQATVRTFTAAPDMLAALKSLYRICIEDEGYKPFNPEMRKAAEAIAKAEGQS